MVRWVVLFGMLVMVALHAPAAQAASPPPGFYPVESAPGVTLYQKDYSGGTPDFVLVVDLSKHSQIHLLSGAIGDPGSGRGAYGGDSPTFSRQSLQSFWEEYSRTQSKALCVLNGAFFSTNEDPAGLAFSLKAGGTIVSEGYGRDEYPGQKLMLEFREDHASLQALDGSALAASSAPDILGGLSEDANKDPSALVGRTFAGIQDVDGDGKAETVLFFSSKTTRQADAAGVLRSFGASQVMMLDGGDSAQLLCSGHPYVYSSRSLPQAIGISAGTVADYEAVIHKQNEWPVLIDGETLEVEIILRNNGALAWQPGEIYLMNLRNDWGAGERLELGSPVAPGEMVTFSWRTTAFSRSGVFTTQWDLMRAGQSISYRPILINVIVLPKELEDQKQELEAKVREWGRQQLDNIEQLVLDWIQQQIRKGFDKICPSAALLPGAVMAAGMVRLRRRKL